MESLENDPAFRAWCENALHDEGTALNAICQAAKRHAIGVEITAFTQGKKYPQNSAYLIDRNGAVLMKYSKVIPVTFHSNVILKAARNSRSVILRISVWAQ